MHSGYQAKIKFYTTWLYHTHVYVAEYLVTKLQKLIHINMYNYVITQITYIT